MERRRELQLGRSGSGSLNGFAAGSGRMGYTAKREWLEFNGSRIHVAGLKPEL